MKAQHTCDWVWWAVKHWGTRDGGKYCQCLNTQPSTELLLRFPSGSVPLEKKKTETHTTLWVESLIATAAVCLQLQREQCRSCEQCRLCVCICVWAHLRMYMHQDVHACLEPICFSALWMWRRWSCIRKTFCVNILPTNTVLFWDGMVVYMVNQLLLSSLHRRPLSKACVGRAAFKEDSKLAWIWIVAIEFKTLAPG